jgi:AraC-like DNA-binding protein
MADTLGLSISYVSRIFKTSMDETVMEYVNRLRMEKAKELLRTTQMPVKEIVEFVGYKDASSFIRKFRQFGHLTPLEYRQHHQDKQS